MSGETLLVEAYAALWVILFGFVFIPGAGNRASTPASPSSSAPSRKATESEHPSTSSSSPASFS